MQRGRSYQSNGAAACDDPAHLADGPDPIGKEHERHLAQRDVELIVRNWQRGHIAPAEVDVGSDPASDSQHRLVEVDTDDSAVGTDDLGGSSGNDARSARDVEHGVARADPGELEQPRRPLSEQRRDEGGLVGLRGLDWDLEGLARCGHVPQCQPTSCRQASGS